MTVLPCSEFIERDPVMMTWEEYGEYIWENTDFTRQQSLILAGDSYGIEKPEIAEVIGTSYNTVRTQSSNIDLNSLSPTKALEIWKTPVPNVPFRIVGEISYVLNDEWPHEGRSGDVEIYFSVQESVGYVSVVERWTLTAEADQIESVEGSWNVSETRNRTIVFESIEAFEQNCKYSLEGIESETNEYGTKVKYIDD